MTGAATAGRGVEAGAGPADGSSAAAAKAPVRARTPQPEGEDSEFGSAPLWQIGTGGAIGDVPHDAASGVVNSAPPL